MKYVPVPISVDTEAQKLFAEFSVTTPDPNRIFTRMRKVLLANFRVSEVNRAMQGFLVIQVTK